MKLTTTLLSFLLVSACNSSVEPDSSPSASDFTGADSVKMDDVPDGTAMANDLVPPSESSALFQFLKSGDYKSLVAEPEVHPSFGPHGDVRVFANQRLVDSLKAGSDSHPVGSAAIKELFKNGALIGWAVEVKVAAASAPESWYWYETFDVETGELALPDGVAITACTGCHNFGEDFVTTTAESFGL